MDQGKVLQLKITLTDAADKPVWREILVPDTVRYDQLHAIIQVLFDWQNAHLHSFRPSTDDNVEYGIVMADDDFGMVETKPEGEFAALPDLKKGPVTYTYDFGDDWRHVIELEDTLNYDKVVAAGHQQLPISINGEGDAPAEDSRMADPAELAAAGITGTAYDEKKINAQLMKLMSWWN